MMAVILKMALLLSIIIGLLIDATIALSPSTTPLDKGISLNSSTSIPVTTMTISPLPLPTADIPRCLSPRDLQVAKLHDYYPLCNVDIPGQDIYPFVWAGNFDWCLEYCDAFNRAGDEGFHFNGKFVKKIQVNENGEWIRCKAALFVPTRVLGMDDCYLKWGLNGSVKTEGKTWIVGGVKRWEQDEAGKSGMASVTVNETLSSGGPALAVETVVEADTTHRPVLENFGAVEDVAVVKDVKEGKEARDHEEKDWAKEILTLSKAVYIH